MTIAIHNHSLIKGFCDSGPLYIGGYCDSARISLFDPPNLCDTCSISIPLSCSVILFIVTQPVRAVTMPYVPVTVVTIAVTVAPFTVTVVTVIFTRRRNFHCYFTTFAWLLQQPSPDHPLPTSLSQLSCDGRGWSGEHSGGSFIGSLAAGI